MYRIGLFSKMNQVTIKTLRHYDETGLLKPAYIDETNGYRYYSSEQLPIVHTILALKQMGFSLDEIKLALNGTSEQELLQRKKVELLKQIAEDTKKLSAVESYLTRKQIPKEYHVIVKRLPAFISASTRKVITDYSELVSLISDREAEMERLGCEMATPEYCFTLYHDEGFKEEQIDVELCESVVKAKADSPLITFKTFPEVKTAACVLHKGSYSDFPNAYHAVICWIEQNGYEIAGYIRESYIDGAWNKENENDWLSEIQIPIRKINK